MQQGIIGQDMDTELYVRASHPLLRRSISGKPIQTPIPTALRRDSRGRIVLPDSRPTWVFTNRRLYCPPLRVARALTQFGAALQCEDRLVVRAQTSWSMLASFAASSPFPILGFVQIVTFSDIDLPSGVTVHYCCQAGCSFPANGEMTVPDMSFHVSIPAPGSDSRGTVLSFRPAR